MVKVLYIIVYLYDEVIFYSMVIGKVFIEFYKEVNFNDEVVYIDLYKENILYIDVDVFSGWGKF